jgi:hypothetical protein
MRRFPLTQFTVHQNADLSLIVRTAGAPHPAETLHAALRDIFGPDQTIAIGALPDDGQKRIPYSTDVS